MVKVSCFRLFSKLHSIAKIALLGIFFTKFFNHVFTHALKIPLCFWCLGIGILEAAPVVEASIDSMNTQAHFPLEGTLTITRGKEEKIDPQSFQMNKKPLEASFVKDVKMTGDTLITIYSFQLPAQEKGLYVLPSIAVKVGGQTYQTVPSTYEVQNETTTSSTNVSSVKPTGPVIFRLEAMVNGPSVLYPGERTKLLYRISYNRSVDLTRSELPMVHPAHFEKVGDVQIRDYQQQDLTMQDLTQEVEASDLGTFQLGPSTIEGYAYTMKLGQKTYEPTLLKSKVPAVTIEVKPFPQPDQPPSFTGALGRIKAEANLESPSSVFIGDNVQLQIHIQGITNLTELHLPLLQCQPGFSGFFQTSDLPPLAEVKDNGKIFQVELRPLTTLIEQIPSIELSSFDPKNGKYVIQHTSPLPITVNSHPLELPFTNSVPILRRSPSFGKWPSPLLSTIEIEGRPVQMDEMKVTGFRGYWTFWLLPLSLGLLLLQKRWHDRWQQRPRPQIPKSEELYRQALKRDQFKSVESLQLLEKAFWHRLWEKGVVAQGVLQLNKIPEEGELKVIRPFLFQLQALQYSLDKVFDPLQIKKQAQQLFDKI
jgi:hypothetical protein